MSNYFSVFRYGEIVHINLVRDKETGKQKGYCFLCYEDQRSTILAVDNLNGIKVRLFLIYIFLNIQIFNICILFFRF